MCPISCCVTGAGIPLKAAGVHLTAAGVPSFQCSSLMFFSDGFVLPLVPFFGLFLVDPSSSVVSDPSLLAGSRCPWVGCLFLGGIAEEFS